MPITVTGALDDGLHVQITGRADRPVIGVATGLRPSGSSTRAREITLFPTGPKKVVAGGDAASVLAVLHEYTNVSSERESLTDGRAYPAVEPI